MTLVEARRPESDGGRPPAAAVAPAVVTVRGLVKTYQPGKEIVPAVNGIDLDVRAGEFLVIVGPSGSGKSTLLHLMGGLDRPTSGEVSVCGRSLSTASDAEISLLRRRRIGFVFQSFNLLPTLDAEENVALPLLLDGRSSSSVRARVRGLLERVGLGHRSSHFPDEMSGGEMQRVAIARALVADPTVVLADEPTGNLDSASGTQVCTLIRDACRELGKAIVMVTHDPRAAEYGDRRLTLVDGRVVADVALPKLER